MQVLIDTNAYSALMRDQLNAEKILERLEFVIPLIVIGELRGGFKNGSKESFNEQLLTEFLAISRVLALDIDTTFEYAKLYAAGRPIPQNDLWIAALCFQHNLPIITFDSYFHFIDGLKIITKISDLLE